MLEKLGKIIRDLFVHGTQPRDNKPVAEVGKPINDKVEVSAPKVEEKNPSNDNVVVAPIKKQRATKNPDTTPIVNEVAKPKVTRARKTTTPKK